MSSSALCKKIRRSNKTACKFRFGCKFQEVIIQCSPQWQPTKIAVAWVHRGRRYVTKPQKWEPTLTDPYRGTAIWPGTIPELLEICTTLYRDAKGTYEDKEWSFVVEEVSLDKPKQLASVPLNLEMFTKDVPGTLSEIQLKLKPLSKHIQSCILQIVLDFTLLKDGTTPEVRSPDVRMSHLCEPDIVQDAQSDLPTSPLLSGERAEEFAHTETDSPSVSGLPKVVETFAVVEQNGDASPFLRCSDKRKTTPGKFVRSNADRDSSPKEIGGASTPHQGASPARNGHANTLGSGDLLTWCQEVTAGYGINVSNFGSSWRNGLAFCALIHCYRPDLIDFDSLSAQDVSENCSKAFQAAACLGVPMLIPPGYMVAMAIPDKVLIMTYLYKLRAVLTGQEVQESEQKASQVQNARWSLGEFEEDEFEKLRSLRIRDSVMLIDRSEERIETFEVQETSLTVSKPSEPASVVTIEKNEPPVLAQENVADSFSEKIETPPKSSRSETFENEAALQSGTKPIGKSETFDLAEKLKNEAFADRNGETERPVKLDVTEILEGSGEYTLVEFTRESPPSVSGGAVCAAKPFGLSPGKEKASSSNSATPVFAPRIPPPLATSGFAATSKDKSASSSPSPKKSPAVTNGSSPAKLSVFPGALAHLQQPDSFKRFGSMRASDLKEMTANLSKYLHRSSGLSAQDAVTPNDLPSPMARQASVPQSPVEEASASGPVDINDAAYSGIKVAEANPQSAEEIEAELRTLSEKQAKLDERGAVIEQQLRSAIDEKGNTEAEKLQEKLMDDYLAVLNERNILTRREHQLHILQKIKEHEKEFRRVELDLSNLFQIDDSEKTETIKVQIDCLMDKLLLLVNKRDELSRQLMLNEQGTEEEQDAMKELLLSKGISKEAAEKNCVIQ